MHKFKLFISGDSSRGRAARLVLVALCERHLAGRYQIETVDVLTDPDQAEAYRIIVTPAVLKLEPPPPRRAVGDMRESEQVIRALGIALDDLGGEARSEMRSAG